MKKILIAAALLALTACGDDLDGTVLQKNYEASHTTVSPTTLCGVNGCSTGVTTNYTPECYRLVVQTVEGDVKTACVDEARWAMAVVGEKYVGEDVE